MMATGSYVGTQSPKAEREPSLNERLNRTSTRLQEQCDRLESVLSRVNGTPSKPVEGRDSPAQIHPTLPLATVVEHLEAVQSRLIDLACGIERIA